MAYLKNADLAGADLTGADLNDAGLVWTRLYAANLTGVKLSSTLLVGVDLTLAEGIIRVGPSIDGYEFYGVVRDGKVWIKAGCRWFTADDARWHWMKTRCSTSIGKERLRFVDLIENHFNGE